jgi:hypothetical protein
VQRERKLARLLRADLDEGEAEAIALGVETGAGRILLDEREGRKKARALELAVTGALGVLLWAKKTGRLESMAAAIQALKDQAGFYVASGLEDALLTEAGEV